MLIDGDGRTGSCGVWHAGTADDGTRVGVLRIHRELLAVPGAARRLVSCVKAVRSAGLGGVLTITDVIQRPGDGGDDVWLTTSAPATPTLAEVGTAADAAGLLHDIGEALLALHAAGIAHGALASSTVVLGPAGRPQLIEVGLRAALTGTAADPADDVRQWAQLSREFATNGGGPLLARCADLAETESLTAAVTALAPEPAASPPVAAEGESGRTMLGRRGTTATTTATEFRSGAEVIRFGPGVPLLSASSAARSPAGVVRPRRQLTRRRALSALVTIAVVTSVALWWWHRLGGLGVETASVRATPPIAGCATTIDVVGVIATNGRRGVIRYQWRRNDGQPTSRLSQDVRNGQHSATVHLAWSIAGHGDFDAVVSLDVLSPQSIHAFGQFSYHCR